MPTKATMPRVSRAICASDASAASDEAGPEQEVLRRIAGDRELGEEDDVGAGLFGLVQPREDPLAVPVEVADRRVDLSERESHRFSTVSLKHTLPRMETLTIGRALQRSGRLGERRLHVRADRRRSLGGSAEVTLRSPPPLERPLAVERDGDVLRVRRRRDRGRRGRPGLGSSSSVPEPPRPGRRLRPRRALPRLRGARLPALLRLRPEPRARRRPAHLRRPAGRLALRGAVDTRPRSRPEFVWAALDCPGAIAVGFPDRGETLLGRRRPRSTSSRSRRALRRRRLAARRGRPKALRRTALYGEDGRMLATARATWIAPS